MPSAERETDLPDESFAASPSISAPNCIKPDAVSGKLVVNVKLSLLFGSASLISVNCVGTVTVAALLLFVSVMSFVAVMIAVLVNVVALLAYCPVTVMMPLTPVGKSPIDHTYGLAVDDGVVPGVVTLTN